MQAFLHSLQGYNFSHGQHGVLAASFLGDYVAITVALFGLDDQVTDITIIGSHLLGENTWTFNSLTFCVCHL